MSKGEFGIRTTGKYQLDGPGQKVDLDELRRRPGKLMPGGRHGWVIQVVHGVDDPEQAMTEMVLDEQTLVGITTITCLWCAVAYKREIRFATCSQRPAGDANS